MSTMVKFTEKDVKDYLDRAIKHWQCEKNLKIDTDYTVMANCYVDAFQTVRMSLFGEFCEKEKQ